MSDDCRGWLLQRLNKPPKTDWDKRIDRAFSFGGGGSGLSKEAWDILHTLFSFDYMGSAEYEFGAVPKMLQEFLKDRKNVVAFTHMLSPKDTTGNRARSYRKDLKDIPKLSKDVPIYILCREPHRQKVIDLIGRMAKDEHRTKEYTNFLGAIDPLEDFDKKVHGWMDLADGFFIFVDEEMWKRTCETFEVKLP